MGKADWWRVNAVRRGTEVSLAQAGVAGVRLWIRERPWAKECDSIGRPIPARLRPVRCKIMLQRSGC